MCITRRTVVLLSAIFAVLSCTDPSTPVLPRSVRVVGGGGQVGAVASALPQPIVVEVTDGNGKAIRGATVEWDIVTGGGAVSDVVTTTDSDGRASVQWTLGTRSGEHWLGASVAGVSPAIVIAIAEPGAPESLVILAGDNQPGFASLALADPLAVHVRDAHGNGVPGINVAFTPSAGTVSPSSSQTNVNGIALTSWTLGPATGQQTVDATVGGLSVRFTSVVETLNQIQVLENGVPVAGINGSVGSRRYFRIAVPEGTMRLAVTTVGPNGDADLYVRRDALPTVTVFGCRSITPLSTENCTFEAPAAGDWYIMVDAYNAYSDVVLSATHVTGGSIALTVDGLPAGASAGITLTGNALSRSIPASQTLGGLLPGSYTLNAGNIIHGGAAYNATPVSQEVVVEPGDTTAVTVTYAVASGLNLDITRAYITQGVQRPTGSVPLVAGRPGLVRVFARGSNINTATPAVRVRVYHEGRVVDTRLIATPGTAVPIVHDDGVLATSYNVLLPGTLIRPGMGILVDIDVDDDVAETNETDNTWPASGTPFTPEVRTATVMQGRLVPIRQSDGSTGDVTPGNVDSYITTAQALYPFPDVDVDVRAPYTFSGVLPGVYTTEWVRLLSELAALRFSDGSLRYYFGVIKPSYTAGGTGIGYISYPAALGVDWQNWRAETVAHEWGHNFGRLHVACGGPSGTDPMYPYTDRPGALGHHGYDMRTNTIRSRDTHHDLMGYCQPTWSSDYTYEAVMAFRAVEAGRVASAEPSLLVWGRISADGAVLEPVFEVVTRPVLPERRGKYRVTGTDATGATVLDLSFNGYEVDHMPGEVHFAYAVPIRSLRGAALAELRLSGAPGGTVRVEAGPTPSGAAPVADVAATRAGPGSVRLQWDVTRSPVLMVRDPQTGQVLSFARGGDTRITTSAAELEIDTSDGVTTGKRRVVVR